MLHISGWSSGSVAGVAPSQGVLMHSCQGVGRPPHVPSTPSHLEPELLLMASRCVLRPLRGRHPRGHTCSPGHLHPQSLVQDTVSIRWHPGPSKVREGQMFSLFGWPLAPEDSVSFLFPVWDSGRHMRVVLWNKTIWNSPLSKIRWLDSQPFKGARLPWTVCATSVARPVNLWPRPISAYVCKSFCSSFLRSVRFPASHSKVSLVHNANSIWVYSLTHVTPIWPLLLRLSKA